MSRILFSVTDYDLAATLSSGQAFRWRFADGFWTGVIGHHWVRLKNDGAAIEIQTEGPVTEWSWLRSYLQVGQDLRQILSTFPDDEPMQAVVNGCRGLRLLRQEPWECLASFILSSTKQIIQIQQIVAQVCTRFGEPLRVPSGHPGEFSFPSAERLAGVSEAELRACRMGFRAPYLLRAAQRVASRELDLARLGQYDLETARARLMELRGVGRKIADCVLLFAYGFPAAFPVDIWIMKGLRELYFRRRRVTLKRLQGFAQTHFGPNAGYAQQYLFHYMRTKQLRHDPGV
jgi:N-glycosylase/DNA lyase